MKKKIWIWNHYATNMMYDKAGRHFWLSEKLKKEGYDVTVFCASTLHNSSEIVNTNGEDYIIKESNNIPFVVIDSPKYSRNGKDRLKNMLTFYRKLFPTSKNMAEAYGNPDVIIASSVHPLTLVAGLKIAKKIGVPCICEIRDLWPESLVAYGNLKRNSFITKLLYQGERWIYKNAHAIIMTWEGGKEYIIDKGWEKNIDINKIEYISNGVVLNDFDNNVLNFEYKDPDLIDLDYKNFVYTGSIRKVNNLGMLLDAAKIILLHNKKIRFLIFGSGDEKKSLEARCKEEGITNVIFKEKVEKKMVPSILTQSYANILHNTSTSLNKYGQSQNKLFEYLAAGKCIVQTYTTGYSVVDNMNCGISILEQTPEEIARVILEICEDNEKVEELGKNARNASYNFDFTTLTHKLIKLIEKV